MKYFFTFLLFCFLISTCTNSNLKNKKLKSNSEEFHNCIEIILLWEKGFPFDLKVISKAYRSLELITGIKSQVLLTDVPYSYLNENSLFKDIENWLAWYETNKEDFEKKDFENFFKENYLPLPDYSDTFVIERIKLIHPKSKNLDSLINIDSLSFISNRVSFPPKLIDIFLQSSPPVQEGD